MNAENLILHYFVRVNDLPHLLSEVVFAPTDPMDVCERWESRRRGS